MVLKKAYELFMRSYRTSSLSRSNHPEISFFASDSPASENASAQLIRYFEGQVAAGASFRPGETVQFGWSTLRLHQREDGTLGLEELATKREIQWIDSADRATSDCWFQVEVARSLGLVDQLSFPRHDDGALVQPCVDPNQDVLLHRMPVAQCPEGFSGWSVSCRQEHQHEKQEILPLMAVAAVQPQLVQFLALPHETFVMIGWRRARQGKSLVIEPRFFADEGRRELIPSADSLLGRLRNL
jgi:hypothetical protein